MIMNWCGSAFPQETYCYAAFIALCIIERNLFCVEHVILLLNLNTDTAV